jgi:hypothetical protein
MGFSFPTLNPSRYVQACIRDLAQPSQPVAIKEREIKNLNKRGKKKIEKVLRSRQGII